MHEKKGKIQQTVKLFTEPQTALKNPGCIISAYTKKGIQGSNLPFHWSVNKFFSFFFLVPWHLRHQLIDWIKLMLSHKWNVQNFKLLPLQLEEDHTTVFLVHLFWWFFFFYTMSVIFGELQHYNLELGCKVSEPSFNFWLHHFTLCDPRQVIWFSDSVSFSVKWGQ